MRVSVLKKLQDRYGRALEEILGARLPSDEGLAAFGGMMRYQLGYVDENLETANFTGGKRFRPFLCLLVTESLGGKLGDALPTASAIELLHNFSLIHDDIEDQDTSRRHKPTLWKVWGEPHAVNAGDGMFAIASRTILETPCEPKVVLRLSQAFEEMSLALTKGQFLDMSFEERIDVSRIEYFRMIELKSGALIEFSGWSGAVLAAADAQVSQALRLFGREFGKAFQIQDDIRGIWAEEKSTGKVAEKDLLNRKKTLPVVLAKERGAASQVATLDAFFARENDDVSSVLAILADTGVREDCEHEARDHLQKATSSLDELPMDPGFRQELIDLAVELTGQ